MPGKTIFLPLDHGQQMAVGQAGIPYVDFSIESEVGVLVEEISLKHFWPLSILRRSLRQRVPSRESTATHWPSVGALISVLVGVAKWSRVSGTARVAASSSR